MSFAAAARALQPRELLVVGPKGGEMGKEELAQYFAQFGEVESVKVHKATGLPSCFALVAFKEPSGTQSLHEIWLHS